MSVDTGDLKDAGMPSGEAFDWRFRGVFEGAGVRVVALRLGSAWQAIAQPHDYPKALCSLLGESVAALALLAATVKMQGRLILQLQSKLESAPVRMLVAQADELGHLRGLARFAEGALDAVDEDRLSALLGDGFLAMTLEPSNGERHQGIVALGDGRLSDALEGYFRDSEQLPTRLWLAADGACAAGLLIQVLPDAPNDDADAFERLSLLGDTLRAGELLETPSLELLRRLFHEETLRVFDPEPLSFRCSCSRDKLAQSLMSLGRESLEGLLEEQDDAVSLCCEFCQREYRFDAVDVAGMFAGLSSPGVDRSSN